VARRRFNLAFFATLATLTLSGCGPDPFYLPSLAGGQLDVLLNAKPIEQVISDGTLSEVEAAKLRLIEDARTYARDELGLQAGDSFTLYYDVRDATRLYNVSASHADRLTPLTWSFPIVGTVPYLGFFDLSAATNQADQLSASGFDVYTYEVDAYSTLNFLPNPVRSTMLQRGDISLVETVFHELLHNTVWRPGDVTFSESLATFVGRTAALEYIRARFPDSPEFESSAVAQFQDSDRYVAFIFELQNDLTDFYNSDRTTEEKLAGREAIFQAARDRFVSDVQPLMNAPESYDWVADLPTNNAWILANFRYNLDLDVFEQVYETTNRSWSRTIALFTEAAATPDPKAFLRNWLDAPTITAKPHPLAPFAHRATMPRRCSASSR
jgi:predicted aminopeptidase